MNHTATRTPRFDREWKELLELLPSDRRSIVENAIRTYQKVQTMPSELSGTEMMAFLLIKKTVDRRTRQRLARRHKKTQLQPKATKPQPQPQPQQPSTLTKPETTQPAPKEQPPHKATPPHNKPARPRPESEKRRTIQKRFNRLNARTRT